MNKRERGTDTKKRRFFGSNIKESAVLIVLGLALVFGAWKIFQGDAHRESVEAIAMSENEQKITKLLEQIDGVGNASVVICETEEEIKSVVVVCEGAENLRVAMNVREAVSAALGTEQKLIKIYLKKE